jgi:hypothetical protein
MSEFLDDVLKALTAATGQNVYFASPQYRWCATTTMNASEESARSVLDRFFKEIKVGYASLPNKGSGTYDVPSSMSWQFWGFPSPGPYGLRIHTVTPENRSPVGMGPPCTALFN